MKPFYRVFICCHILLMVALTTISATGFTQQADSIQAHFTVTQVDSLIQANADNPDFCVMDVRTPAEYDPEHLEGAINRNHNGAGFDSLLNLLPRHKMYVLYCLSGGRSGSTFNKMKAMGFPSIVNMLGGITAWKNASLPTTPDFAPWQMAVSDTIIPNDTVYLGDIDTIYLTITNRANDILQFTSVSPLPGGEFTTDFDTTTTLEGPYDYTFAIFYAPTDTLTDSITFRIESNGGPVQFHITRTGKTSLIGVEEFKISNFEFRISNFPNPFTSSTTLEFEMGMSGEVEIIIYNQFGQIVDDIVQIGQRGINKITWHAGSLPVGVYVCRILAGRKSATSKMILKR